jgi:hypothetical protein
MASSLRDRLASTKLKKVVCISVLTLTYAVAWSFTG